MKYGIVIPAYQAGPSVGEIVRRAIALGTAQDVIVVDDGSTDDTGRAAREAGAQVLRHDENRGKGAAMQTGFAEWMQRDVEGVVTLDADGQHLPEEVHKLIAAAAGGADLVLGVRDHLFAEMNRLRRTSNRISTGLISYAAQNTVSDVQTGFRYYSRRLIETVGLRESGFEAESAVFVRASRRGLRVVTTQIDLGFSDGTCTSHYRPWQDSVRIARAVVGAMRDATSDV